MKSKLMMPAFIGLTVVLFACDRVASHEEDEANAAAKTDPAADGEAVRKLEQAMLASFKARDGARLAQYYADDAVTASPGQGQIEGREAIGQALQQELSDPAFAIDFASDKIEASGDLAYSRGRYTVTYTNPQTKKPEQGRGSYVTVFRRHDGGEWKVAAEVIHSGG